MVISGKYLRIGTESQNQREIQEGIDGGPIIDAISFGGFLNDEIATEHPFKK